MVFVERTQIGRHVWHVLPRFGNQHRHGVQETPPRRGKQLQRFVQGGGIGAHRCDHRDQIFQVLSPDGGRELGLARGHPVAIPDECVDFAVVRDHAERLCQTPVRECVGGEALVEKCQRGPCARVSEVGKEAAQLRSHHEALVHHRAGGHRNDVGVDVVLAVRGFCASTR